MKRPLGGVWPFYTEACRRDMDQLLAKGGSLSAYRASPTWPKGPTKGSWAHRFEQTASKMFGIRHVMACSSGTMALMAALRAVDLPAGAEVATSSYTFSATAAAIRWAGYVPVFADVDPRTGCLDPKSVAEAVGPKTFALLPVDLFGWLSDYESLSDLSEMIIEDSCQAVGAWRGGNLAGGAFGHVAVWSFNGAKNCPAGEAGAVVTNVDWIAARARLFLNHGENFESIGIGLNGRLAEPLALLAYHGLKELPKRNAQRQALAMVLNARLKDLPEIAALPNPDGHALYVYPLILEPATYINRSDVAKRLRRMGVEVSEGYTTPLHLLDAFRHCRRTALPVVERLYRETLLLFTQVRPPATRADMEWLGDAIVAAIRGTQAPKRKRIGATPVDQV